MLKLSRARFLSESCENTWHQDCNAIRKRRTAAATRIGFSRAKQHKIVHACSASSKTIKSNQKAVDRTMMIEVGTRNTQTPEDRRQRQRFCINAPVSFSLGGCEVQAYTRDLSSQGLYFYVDSAECLSVGQTIDLLIKLPPEITLSSSCLIRCLGRLLRKEDTPGDSTGIAAAIVQYSILSEAESDC